MKSVQPTDHQVESATDFPDSAVIYATARVVFWSLAIIAITLMFTSTLGYAYSFFDGSNYYLDLLAQKFYIDSEKTVPTWFSSLLMYTCSVLLLFTALVDKNTTQKIDRRWAFLAFLFVAMSVDESVSIHEEALDFLSPIIGIKFIHFWVIPMAPMVLILGVVYWRFLSSLAPETRRGLLIGAAVFFGGALGVETIGGVIAEANGKASYAYMAATHVEEFMEMLGMVILVTTMMNHLALLRANLIFSQAEMPALDS